MTFWLLAPLIQSSQKVTSVPEPDIFNGDSFSDTNSILKCLKDFFFKPEGKQRKRKNIREKKKVTLTFSDYKILCLNTRRKEERNDRDRGRQGERKGEGGKINNSKILNSKFQTSI